MYDVETVGEERSITLYDVKTVGEEGDLPLCMMSEEGDPL